MNSRILSLVLLLALSSTTLVAQRDTNGDSFVDALIPIVVTSAGGQNDVVSGAYGSRWATEVFLRNDNNGPFLTIQRSAYPACEIFWEVPCSTIHPPGQTTRAFVFSQQADRGALLSFSKFDAPNVTLSARLLELSRNAQPNGVNIPVIWEDQYLTRPASLIAIPQREESRVAIRVYDPRMKRGSAVRVDILSSTGDIIESTVLHPGDHLTDQPYLPGGDSITDIAAVFPHVRDFDQFDIRVTPLIEGMEYWAFVSVTDRDTQHVLLITP